MAYFDNASTTYPKPYCVYDFMDSFYRSSGANAGRGNYKLAAECRSFNWRYTKEDSGALALPGKAGCI